MKHACPPLVLLAFVLVCTPSAQSVKPTGIPVQGPILEVDGVEMYAWVSNESFFPLLESIPLDESKVLYTVFSWPDALAWPRVDVRVRAEPEDVRFLERTSWSTPMLRGGTSPLCNEPQVCYESGFAFTSATPLPHAGTLVLNMTVTRGNDTAASGEALLNITFANAAIHIAGDGRSDAPGPALTLVVAACLLGALWRRR